MLAVLDIVREESELWLGHRCTFVAMILTLFSQ